MQFIEFPVLTTQRLTLRQTTKDDWEEVLFLRSDEEVNKYVKRQAPKTKTDAEEFIAKITRGLTNGEIIYWSITLKESPEMIGSICLWNFSPDRTIAEVGYDLVPQFQNRGIMSEALKCVLNFGFNSLNLKEIEAFTHHANESSKKLLTKNNFRLDPDRRDDDNADNLIYSRSGELKVYSYS